MSGSGSSGGSGDGGSGGSGYGGEGGAINCAKLIEITILNSPSPDVIAQLNPNDILQIQLLDEAPPRVVAIHDSGIAGSITIRSLAKLIECLEQGVTFIGIVKDIDGGMCRVQIRPESKL